MTSHRHLSSDAVVIKNQSREAVDAFIEERIEVDDVGRTDLQKSIRVSAAPALERGALQRKNFVRVMLGHRVFPIEGRAPEKLDRVALRSGNDPRRPFGV